MIWKTCCKDFPAQKVSLTSLSSGHQHCFIPLASFLTLLKCNHFWEQWHRSSSFFSSFFNWSTVDLQCCVISGIQLSYLYIFGFHGRICLQCRRCGFNPWVRKIPWRYTYIYVHIYICVRIHIYIDRERDTDSFPKKLLQLHSRTAGKRMGSGARLRESPPSSSTHSCVALGRLFILFLSPISSSVRWG